jgi:hypothetical protein
MSTPLLDNPAPPSADPPDGDDRDDNHDNDNDRPVRWTTIATFNTSAEAHLARLRLEAEDIDCFIADENVVSIAWHYSLATGGIKLQVDAADVPRATALLASRCDTDHAESPRLDDNDHCPRCNSTRITHDGFTPRRIFGLAFLTATACSLHWIVAGVLLSVCVVLIVRASGQRCEDCNNQWDIRRGFAIVPTARVAPVRDDDRSS